MINIEPLATQTPSPIPLSGGKKQSASLYRTLLLTAATLLLFALAGTGYFYYSLNTLNASAMSEERQKVERAVAKMETLYKKLEDTANEKAKLISTGRLTEKDLGKMSLQVMEEIPEATGFFIAFEPYRFKADQKLWWQYHYRKDGITVRDNDPSFDYRDENSEAKHYYLEPLKKGRTWTEPYFEASTGSYLTDYSCPFYLPGSSEPAGVISISYSLRDTANFIREDLDLMGNGYAYLLTSTGKLIFHPDPVYQGDNKNILREIAGKNGYVDLEKGIQTAIAGKPYENDRFIDSFGQEEWVFIQPLPTTGYILVAEVAKNHLQQQDTLSLKYRLIISLLLTFGLCYLWIALLPRVGAFPKGFKRVSVAVSLTLLCEILFLWSGAYHFNYEQDDAVRLSNKNAIYTYLADHSTHGHSDSSIPFFVPTGLEVQTLSISNSNVKITGLLWQKYAQDYPAGWKKGFVFPDAVELKLFEEYNFKEKENEIIGWRFEALVNQDLEFKRYPFDKEIITLKIVPAEIQSPVELAPDVAAYKNLAPQNLPGIKKDMGVGGWKMDRSYFALDYSRPKTNYGSSAINPYQLQPELCFQIEMQRKLTSSFVTHFLPLLVISFVLFMSNKMIIADNALTVRFNAQAHRILASCTALFFAAILLHNQLRSAISTSGIIYLEYLLIVIYLFIVSTVVYAYLAVKWEAENEGIKLYTRWVPSLIYWPLQLGLILVITYLAVFPF